MMIKERNVGVKVDNNNEESWMGSYPSRNLNDKIDDSYDDTDLNKRFSINSNGGKKVVNIFPNFVSSISHLQGQYDQMTTSLGNYHQLNEQLQNQVASLTVALKDCESKLSLCHREYQSELENRLDELNQSHLETLILSDQRWKSRVKDLENALDEAEIQSQRTMKNATETSNRLVSVESDLSNLQKNHAAILVALEQIEKKHAFAENRLREKDVEIQGLKDSMKRELQTRDDVLTSVRETMRAEIYRKDEIIADLSRKLSDTNSEKEVLAMEHKDLFQEYQQYEKDVEANSASYSELIKTMSFDFEARKQKFLSMLDEKEEKIRNLTETSRKQAMSHNLALDQVNMEWSRKMESLRLDMEKSGIEGKEERSQLVSQIQSLHDTIQQLSNEKLTLQTEIEAQQNIMQQLKVTNDNLEKDRDLLSGQIEQLISSRQKQMNPNKFTKANDKKEESKNDSDIEPDENAILKDLERHERRLSSNYDDFLNNETCWYDDKNDNKNDNKNDDYVIDNKSKNKNDDKNESLLEQVDVNVVLDDQRESYMPPLQLLYSLRIDLNRLECMINQFPQNLMITQNDKPKPNPNPNHNPNSKISETVCQVIRDLGSVLGRYQQMVLDTVVDCEKYRQDRDLLQSMVESLQDEMDDLFRENEKLLYLCNERSAASSHPTSHHQPTTISKNGPTIIDATTTTNLVEKREFVAVSSSIPPKPKPQSHVIHQSDKMTSSQQQQQQIKKKQEHGSSSSKQPTNPWLPLNKTD